MFRPVYSIYLLLFFFLNSCALLTQFIGQENQPSFSLKNVSISSITLETIQLKVLAGVRNPYPVTLPKSILNMDVLIEGSKFGNFSNMDLGKIEAKSTRDIPVDVVLKYSDLLEIYKKLPGKEILEVSLNGNIDVPIPESLPAVGQKSFTFPFQEKKQIPAILPTIEITNFKIIKPDPQKIIASSGSALAGSAMSYLDNLLGGGGKSAGSAVSAGLSAIEVDVDTEFDLVLTNKASSKLNFSSLKYNLDLNNEKFLSGNPGQIINNGKESIIKIKSSFPLKSVSSGIAAAIQKKSSDFQLKGDSLLGIEALGNEKINFSFDKMGNFKW